MSPTTVLIALAALLATSLSLKAEGSKPEQSQAEQPYTDQLGDNQVTSVKRLLPPAWGGPVYQSPPVYQERELSREELLRAAREALPTTISPPATDTKPDEQ
jgi:hypothetical protein